MKKYQMILTISLVLTFYSCQERQLNTKPNIIFIMADDLGYGELGVASIIGALTLIQADRIIPRRSPL